MIEIASALGLCFFVALLMSASHHQKQLLASSKHGNELRELKRELDATRKALHASFAKNERLMHFLERLDEKSGGGGRLQEEEKEEEESQ